MRIKAFSKRNRHFERIIIDGYSESQEPDKYSQMVGDSMRGSLKGRLKKFDPAKNRGLDAVLEAVVNSIQALSGRKDGKIVVRAKRNGAQKRLDDEGSAWINDFEIEDNGPGFNRDNLISFDTLDSTFKEKDFGCKGVGRLLWLRVFEYAIIDSVFQDEDGFRKIKFIFEPERNDYGDEPSYECEGPLKTIITLKNCQPKYRDSLNVMPSTLARKILNHCFASFILGDVPTIEIKYDGEEPESVNALFEESKDNVTTGNFDVKGVRGNSESFKVNHVRFYNWSEPGNRIEYCANNRTVKTVKIIPDVDLVDKEGNKFTYCAYISGQYLDDNVNDERTDFTIPLEHMVDDDAISFREISSKTEVMCREFLKPYMAKDIEMRERLLDSVIENHPDVAIVKRHYENILDEIGPKDSQEKIYTLLNTKVAEIESKTIFKLDKVLGKKVPFETSEDVNRMFDEVEEVYRSNLTKYILHRKRIIEIFEEGLKRDWSEEGGGKYQKEEYIHDMLLPMRSKVGDIIDIENCNLWMIDERLNFYAFTSAFSDTPRKLMLKEKNDGKRPDLFVFSEMERGIARSVTVIELKRPNRKDSEVVDQIVGYASELKGNEIETPYGKVRVSDDAVISTYILSDLTVPGAQTFYTNRDYSRSHDGTRFYYWYKTLGISVEVIDYTKLSQDANIRNQVFFDILNVKVEGGDPRIAEYHRKQKEYHKDKKNGNRKKTG